LSEIANARLRGVCAGPAAGPGEDNVTAGGCECSGDGRDAGTPVAAGPADGRAPHLACDVPAAGVMTRRPGVLPGGWRERCAGGVPALHVGSCRTAACTGRTGEPCCRTRSVTRLTRHGDISVCIVRFRERRGSQGCSCTPGWPGQATGGRQLRAGGDQLPDGPGRLCYGPPAHRGRHRDRAAGVRPWHGGRRGAQRSGRNGKNVRRDAGGFAAAARDRGPFSIPGGA